MIGTFLTIKKTEANENCSFVKNPYVSFYPSQIRKLKEIAHSEGKAVAEVIREAVKRFLAKPVPEGNALNFNSSSTEAVKRVYPRVPQSDWDTLNRISARTSRTRTELVREAVDGYLSSDPSV